MRGCPQSLRPPRRSCRCYLRATRPTSALLTGQVKISEKPIKMHTHESSLAFLLHEEQLSPVGGSSLYSKHHQVAQRQHPQERREEEFTQGALAVTWWHTGDVHNLKLKRLAMTVVIWCLYCTSVIKIYNLRQTRVQGLQGEIPGPIPSNWRTQVVNTLFEIRIMVNYCYCHLHKPTTPALSLIHVYVYFQKLSRPWTHKQTDGTHDKQPPTLPSSGDIRLKTGSLVTYLQHVH